MLHFETLEILKEGGARLMIANTIRFDVKAFRTASGTFDSRSAPAHR